MLIAALLSLPPARGAPTGEARAIAGVAGAERGLLQPIEVEGGCHGDPGPAERGTRGQGRKDWPTYQPKETLTTYANGVSFDL